MRTDQNESCVQSGRPYAYDNDIESIDDVYNSAYRREIEYSVNQRKKRRIRKWRNK